MNLAFLACASPSRPHGALRQAQGVVSLSPLDYARGDPEPAEGSNHGADDRCERDTSFVPFVSFVVQFVDRRPVAVPSPCMYTYALK